MTNIPWDGNSTNLVAITNPLYNGYPSSVLNVLKEDGFNIVQTYQPGTYHTSETEIASIAQLFKNIGMQVLFSNRDWYKPTAITYSVWDPGSNDTWYSTTGINIYDNSDNTLSRYNDPTYLMKVRPNFLNTINAVYSDPNFSSTIWGHQLCEEASAAHPFNPNNYWVNWNDKSPLNYWTELPPSNVQSALGYFKTTLASNGILNQKVTVMEANHHKTINDNSNDGFGFFKPKDYVKLLDKTDARDAFFEGSYTQFPYNAWLTGQSYSTMINTNGFHYLGPLRSIDYAKNYTSNVHKVMSIELFNPSLKYHYQSDGSIENANWLWFQSYTSIIHVAKGVWFWDLGQAFTGATGDINNFGSSSLDRFTRAKFPTCYKSFISYLSKEIAYLVKKNLISTDPNTIVYSKTDAADNNCIIPAAAGDSYIKTALTNSYGSAWLNANTAVVNEKCTENYGLRYTIRTNGYEVIMIVSNPMNIPVTVPISFASLGNPYIKNSTGVNVLFETAAFNPATAGAYKTNRNSGIDLTLNTNPQQYYIPYSGNKQITLTFGPMDVHVLKFVSSKPDYNNQWNLTWSNAGSGNINGVNVMDSDILYPGDFDGDGAEELLVVQNTGGSNDWMTILKYVNSDWIWYWSNYGNSTIGNGIYPYRSNLIVGDFDGDGKDEVLGNSTWTTAFKFVNNDWSWWWSDYGNPSNEYTPSYKSKMLAGDFDGDGIDELLAMSLPNGNTVMLQFLNNHFVLEWNDANDQTNPIRSYRPNLYVGDFNGDGRDDILGFSTWATIFDYKLVGSKKKWVWGYWSSNGANNINSWNYPLLSTDKMLIGNLDGDTKSELLFLQSGANASWATSMDMNLTSNPSIWNWNWSANPQYGVPFVDDWPLADNGGSNTKYLLVKAVNGKPKHLLALRKYSLCGGTYKYFVNMYQPSIGSSFKTDNNKEENIAISSTFEKQVSIYPNPSNGAVTISLANFEENEQVSISLYDYTGRFILDKTFNLSISGDGNFNLDLSDLPSALYLLKVSGQNYTSNQSVVKIN